MSKVSQFVTRYLPVEQGYTLICLLEHISRLTGASVDYLLSVALVDEKAAQYLVGCVNRISNQGVKDSNS